MNNCTVRVEKPYLFWIKYFMHNNCSNYFVYNNLHYIQRLNGELYQLFDHII